MKEYNRVIRRIKKDYAEFKKDEPFPREWTVKNVKKRNESHFFVFFLKYPHLFHGLLDNEPPAAWHRAMRRITPEGLFAPAQAYHTTRSLSSSFRGINAVYVGLICIWS